jgi:hypothetical protein
MSRFLRGQADLTGWTIGQFRVVELAGHDAARRQARWKVRCPLGHEMIFSHSQLTNRMQSAAEIFCQNGTCKFSRPEVPRRETIGDIRREEYEAAQQRKQEAAEAKAAAQKKAGAEAALRLEKQKWIRFTNAQMKAGVMPEDEGFMSFERWNRQSEHWRDSILQKLSNGAS